jgi:PAS domain S-box-containing protein
MKGCGGARCHHACNARFSRVVATGDEGAFVIMTSAAASVAVAHASPRLGAPPIPFASALPHAALPPDAARDAIERIAHVGSWELCVDSGHTLWSAEMYRIAGIDPAAPALDTHRDPAMRYAPETWQRIVAATDRAVQAGERFELRVELLRDDGSWRSLIVRGEPCFDSMGRVERVIGTAQDVTDMAAKKAVLREFVRHAPAAIAMLDRELRYLQVSERWLTEHGLAGQDIIGRCHYEIFPDMPEGRRETHQRALRGEVLCGEDQPIQQRDGSMEWISWEVRPWQAHDGSIGGLMIFTLRTTARKRLELALEQQRAELQRYNQDLARSNQELEQYAYIASHDLQEPLRAIVGCGQLLAQHCSTGLDSTASSLVGHMVEGGLRMQRLVSDLLAYSRVGTGERRAVHVDMAAALRQAMAQLAVAIGETSASIEADDLPAVSADPTQVVQLLQNLLGNALKYRSAERPRVRVRAARAGAFIEFCVADNGIGIEPQYFERIFVIFQRLHTRTAYPGTGIGLSLCRKIVERHGGRIWVESEPARGSTFFFTLPAHGGEP